MSTPVLCSAKECTLPLLPSIPARQLRTAATQGNHFFALFELSSLLCWRCHSPRQWRHVHPRPQFSKGMCVIVVPLCPRPATVCHCQGMRRHAHPPPLFAQGMCIVIVPIHPCLTTGCAANGGSGTSTPVLRFLKECVPLLPPSIPIQQLCTTAAQGNQVLVVI